MDHLVQSIGPADGLGGTVCGEAIGPAKVLGVEEGPVGAIHGSMGNHGSGATVCYAEVTEVQMGRTVKMGVVGDRV